MKKSTLKAVCASALLLLSSTAMSFGPGGDNPGNQNFQGNQGPQGNQGGQGKYGKRGARMAKMLNLTPEQAEQVKTIMKAQHEEAKAWRENHQKQTKSKLRAVLSDEQIKKFEQMKEQRKQNRQGRKQGNRQNKGMNRQ